MAWLGIAAFLIGTVITFPAAYYYISTWQSPVQGGAQRVIDVTASQFSWSPDPIEVNLGDVVTLRITSTAENDPTFTNHSIMIHELGVHKELPVGQVTEVTFTANKAGEFDIVCGFYCGVDHGTMIGTLRVVGTGEENISPAKTTTVDSIVMGPTNVPSPLNRSTPATLDIYLEAREVIAEIEPGTTYEYWTFNGTVPGPFFRIRVGDNVVVHFSNAASSTMSHSVDFHAVTGPGGGAVATQTPPGENTSFQFKALNPGLYIYHCATSPVPEHVTNGMYGLILVEPEEGLSPVDREFYVVQGEFYTKWAQGTEGHQEFDRNKMLVEEPTYVVFNGAYRALTSSNALQANVGENIRIFFGVGGVNLGSNFHVIGEIFDRVYYETTGTPLQNAETVYVPPGSGSIFEFKVEVPGTFILVDHALVRAIDKGALGQLVVSGAENSEVFSVP